MSAQDGADEEERGGEEICPSCPSCPTKLSSRNPVSFSKTAPLSPPTLFKIYLGSKASKYSTGSTVVRGVIGSQRGYR